jgi:hypothetical protein
MMFLVSDRTSGAALGMHAWRRTLSARGSTKAATERGTADMNNASRIVDLTQVPAVPWAWVDEHVYAAIRGCSVRVLQNERRLNMGCPFRRINGTSIRYKIGDITDFLESQPGGGGAPTPNVQPQRNVGRPRRSTP